MIRPLIDMQSNKKAHKQQEKNLQIYNVLYKII